MIQSKEIKIESGNIREVGMTPELSLLTSGRCPQVTCGQQVAMGQLIASSGCAGQGNLHAPVAGTVAVVDRWRIVISVADNPDLREEEPQQYDLNNNSGEILREAFIQLGVSLPEIGGANLLIINGARPEPGIGSNEKYLNEFGDEIFRGLEAAQMIYEPQRSVLAVTSGSPARLTGCVTEEVPMTYPNGLDPLVVRTITGKEKNEGVVVLSISDLFELGKVRKSGIPLHETLVQCGEGFFRVRIGTPVGAVLSEAGIAVHDRGRVVLGSRMRGMAAHSLEQGVEKDSLALFFLERTLEPIAEDTPCVGCGECVRNCPANIDPATLSGCAEFGLYEKARDNHIDSCIDCGLCSYLCIARRPVLQYIRLAKRELALMDGSCGEQAEEGAA